MHRPRWAQIAVLGGGILPSCKETMNRGYPCKLMKATTVVLSEWTMTWCPFRAGIKVLRARKITIFRQLMFRHCFSLDQEPNTELPSHRAPQPKFGASFVTTFLLEVSPNWTPIWYRRGAFQGGRPKGITGDTTAISLWILWKALGERKPLSLKMMLANEISVSILARTRILANWSALTVVVCLGVCKVRVGSENKASNTHSWMGDWKANARPQWDITVYSPDRSG